MERSTEAGCCCAIQHHLEDNAHIFECLRITGDDCYVNKLDATSMHQLQHYVDDLAHFGDTTTSIIYSHTLPQRGPIRPLIET